MFDGFNWCKGIVAVYSEGSAGVLKKKTSQWLPKFYWLLNNMSKLPTFSRVWRLHCTSKNLETLVVLIFHQNYLGAVITIQQPFVELFIITYDKVENITQAGTS